MHKYSADFPNLQQTFSLLLHLHSDPLWAKHPLLTKTDFLVHTS